MQRLLGELAQQCGHSRPHSLRRILQALTQSQTHSMCSNAPALLMLRHSWIHTINLCGLRYLICELLPVRNSFSSGLMGQGWCLTASCAAADVTGSSAVRRYTAPPCAAAHHAVGGAAAKACSRRSASANAAGEGGRCTVQNASNRALSLERASTQPAGHRMQPVADPCTIEIRDAAVLSFHAPALSSPGRDGLCLSVTA